MDGTFQNPLTGSMTFIQRGGAPGGIRPATRGPNGPTSIAFRRGEGLPSWEIWNGVQFMGRSGGRHELDIAIVPKDLGDALRGLPSGGWPFGNGWLSLECKDVKANGSPDEMRAFLARIYDTTLLQVHAGYIGLSTPVRKIYATSGLGAGFGTARQSYRVENRSSFHGIARRTGFSLGTAKMSTYYFVRRFENLYVGSSELDVFTSEICDWLDQNLPTTL
jgi:hypothetical protein